MLHAHDLYKYYDHTLRLSAPTFSAKPSEITAIIGPSGAGKSTLLRLLAGLEPPSRGRITLGPHPASAEKLRGSSSLVMQNPIALRGSVLYNAMLGPRLAGKSRSEAQEVAYEMLELVGLDDVKQDARKLSGGQQVRLALARALTRRPDVLLLDEATANVDPYNISRLEHVITAYAQEGHIVVMVTHNLAQARRLSHSTALILGGHLIAQDSSARVFTEHPDARIRAFVEGQVVY